MACCVCVCACACACAGTISESIAPAHGELPDVGTAVERHHDLDHKQERGQATATDDD